MPALTLPFLPPGLSPAASLSLAILPWLLLLLALGGYLARHQILGGAKALLHALRRPARYYIHLAGSSSSSDVLPTTAPAARSTSAQGHAPPQQAQGTLRGRGRARSKPGAGFGFGRNFGLSLGGRRAKSAGPVLPRFASDSREHLVSPHHGASAPASPGLQVPGFMHGDADAVPLVDLGPGLGAGSGDMARSWASLSSFSDIDVSGSGSQSQPHADGLLVDVSHVSAHEDDGEDGMQLVDLSHPHAVSHELVDVSVPPSPAAWAVAHPPPTPLPLPPLARPTPAASTTPTPSFVRPAAVRPHAAAQEQAHSQTSASQIPDSPLTNTNTNITSMNLPPPPPPPSASAVPVPPLVPGLVDVAEVVGPAKRAEREEEEGGGHPHQLPSPPLSPARLPAPPLTLTDGAWEGEGELEARLREADLVALEEAEAPVTALTHGDGEGGVEVELVDVGPGDEAEALWIDETPPLLDLDAESTGLPSARRAVDVDAVVGGMHALAAPPPPPAVSLMDEPAEAETDGEADELPLPSAQRAIDAVVGGMHALELAAPAVSLMDEPAEADELPLPSARAIDAVVGGMHELERAAPPLSPPPPPAVALMDMDMDEPAEANALPLPSARRAIDAVVGGMHEPAAPPPAVSLMDEPAEADADGEADALPLPSARAIDAVVGGMHAFPFPASAPPPLPLSTSAAEGEAAPAYVDEPSPSPSPSPATPTPAYTADPTDPTDPTGLALPVPAPFPLPLRARLFESDGDEDEDGDEEDGGSEHGWDGPVREVAFPEAPTYAHEERPVFSWQRAGVVGDEEEREGGEEEQEEQEEEEDPEELALPFIPLPSPSLPVVVGEEDEDPEELPLPVMPLPLTPHEDDAWDAPPPPALRVSSPPHLLVDTAPAAADGDVDADEREQDLASTLSAFSTTVSPSAPRSRTLDEDESAALLPHHESSDDEEESSSSEDEDEEDDIADTKRATTAWSRRAAAAPALGLPSSTREKEAQVPGAFPGTATSPNFPALSLPAAASTTEEKDAAGTSTAVEKAEKDKARARKYRSPLDAALAMQLRPGLGVGADGAWLVRFLMSFFGWFAVLVARTSD